MHKKYICIQYKMFTLIKFLYNKIYIKIKAITIYFFLINIYNKKKYYILFLSGKKNFFTNVVSTIGVIPIFSLCVLIHLCSVTFDFTLVQMSAKCSLKIKIYVNIMHLKFTTYPVLVNLKIIILI